MIRPGFLSWSPSSHRSLSRYLPKKLICGGDGVSSTGWPAIAVESFTSSLAREGVSWSLSRRLVFEWRAVNFAPAEKTEVEVRFEQGPSGTLVTVTHRGWSRIRADHPARHGLEVTPFIRMMGLWWGDLMGSLREHVAQKRAAPGDDDHAG